MKSIYVHVPFCVKKCRYCAFNSYENKLCLANDYFDAAMRQTDALKREKIETIYIGGGTPSAVNEKYILQILEKIRTHFDVEENAETTIEVNPKTVSEEKFKKYAEGGINRVSIGAQSFNEKELLAIGRIHNSKDVENALDAAHKSGIDNVSIDIMYAIPNQTEKSLDETLKKAVSLDISHISLYGLTVEDETPLADDVKNGRFTPFSDEKYADMYERICDFLEGNGFLHYEISNFARSEKYVSRHNLKYWHGGEYYGIGAGASGYSDGERYTNNVKIEDYIKNPFAKFDAEIIDENGKMSEYMFLNLRLLQSGINVSEFKKKFGRDIFSVFGEKLKFHLENTKMLERHGDKIVLAKKAYYVCNAVMCDFL
ncbi:MAG: radical SAM family heme chaperone HemW [Oscillospiraceae bacterium]|nr:radical SAM family heme chaperone HemW [Oscillospiraceae bacterium]